MYVSIYALTIYFIIKIMLNKFVESKKALYFNIGLDLVLIIFFLVYYFNKINNLDENGRVVIVFFLIAIISVLVFNIYDSYKKIRNND